MAHCWPIRFVFGLWYNVAPKRTRANQLFKLGDNIWRGTGILPVAEKHGQDAREGIRCNGFCGSGLRQLLRVLRCKCMRSGHINCPGLAPIDADLQRVVGVWDELPEHIRKAILALVGD